jgi:malonate transporter and related proteins
MQSVQHIIALTGPLFLLILIGYALTRWGRWPKDASDALTRFVFSIAVPALLFRLLSDFSRMPPVDARLLIAFFGGCLLVFLLGRVVGRQLFGLDGVGQSVFGIGGVFSNNVLLGVPIAKVTLGDAAMPTVSLIVVFNALVLWTLVTLSVEWARTRTASLAGFTQTAWNVIRNPVVAAIVLGTAWGWTGIALPGIAERTLQLVGDAAVPLSLIALGMGLGEFGVAGGWRESLAIAALKLAALPLVVFVLARLLELPGTETRAVVLLASLPVGANVYLMSREFGALTGPVATSLVFSTALAAMTTPLVLIGAS